MPRHAWGAGLVQRPDWVHSGYLLIVVCMTGPPGWQVSMHGCRMNSETRLIMVIGEAHKASDYIQAGRVRSRMTGHLARAFQACDVLVTPTCAITAPAIRCAFGSFVAKADRVQLSHKQEQSLPASLAGAAVAEHAVGFAQSPDGC